MRYSSLRKSWVVLAAVLVAGMGCKSDPEKPCEEPPSSCEALERNCGQVPDACGRVLECGTCAVGQTCGGGAEGLCGGSDCTVECPAGYTCTADNTCTGGTNRTLALDFKTFSVAGRLLRDGAPILDDTCLRLDHHNTSTDILASFLVLTEVTRGTQHSVLVECSREQGWTFRGQVPPGAYRVDFQTHNFFCSQKGLPPRIAEFFSVQSDREDEVFDLSARAVTVEGWLLLGGQPFPSAEGPYRLRFTEVRTGATFELSLAADGTFRGDGTPGVYRVDWLGGREHPEVPTEPRLVASTVRIDGPMEGLTLDLTRLEHEVAGTITRSGQPILDTTCGTTTVRFVERFNGATRTFQARCSQEQGWSFAGRLPAGTYRAEVVTSPFDGTAAVVGLPEALSTVALPSLELRGDTATLALDVKAYAVAGRILNGGAELPLGACESASHPEGDPARYSYVQFINEATRNGSRVRVDCTSGTGWTFTGHVAPGTYLLTIPSTHGPVAPGFVAPATVEVSGDRKELVADLQRHEVAGRISFEGEGASAACLTDTGLPPHLLFMEPRSRRSQLVEIHCDEPAAGSFRGEIYPGTYWVYFQSRRTKNAELFSAFVMDGPRTDLALRAVVTLLPSRPPVGPPPPPPPSPDDTPISGTLTLNGGKIGPVRECGWHTYWPGTTIRVDHPPLVVLTDERRGRTYRLPISCGDGGSEGSVWTFSGWATPGTYRVEVEATSPLLLNRIPGNPYVFNPTIVIP
ncbi:hypothetical protein [Myxococcus sp. RHSTA-1-4]|uniref:hypothetical protein n=1 Tax=Myxococcus sp. RHSTA-1-4 TaxID=2874601 RepID=UPI001CC02DFE|nr:hypothetical protein [Myxococcus sp. RHSTA-1-4]MBZ4417393.1 hypothetical protein [Myxococcus sp. RHSTA-1-4]